MKKAIWGLLLKSKPEFMINCIEKWMNWRHVSNVESTELGDVFDTKVLRWSCPVTPVSGLSIWNEVIS